MNPYFMKKVMDDATTSPATTEPTKFLIAMTCPGADAITEVPEII